MGLSAVRFAHTCAALRTVAPKVRLGALRRLGTPRFAVRRYYPSRGGFAATNMKYEIFAVSRCSTQITQIWKDIKWI